MAQNLTPTHWLPGYTATSSSITIPLSALPGLSSDEADASTGDARKVFRALMAALYAAWLAEDEADLPTRMQVSRSTSVDDLTETTTRTYLLAFRVASEGEEVVDEPSEA